VFENSCRFFGIKIGKIGLFVWFLVLELTISAIMSPFVFVVSALSISSRSYRTYQYRLYVLFEKKTARPKKPPQHFINKFLTKQFPKNEGYKDVKVTELIL